MPRGRLVEGRQWIVVDGLGKLVAVEPTQELQISLGGQFALFRDVPQTNQRVARATERLFFSGVARVELPSQAKVPVGVFGLAELGQRATQQKVRQRMGLVQGNRLPQGSFRLLPVIQAELSCAKRPKQLWRRG